MDVYPILMPKLYLPDLDSQIALYLHFVYQTSVLSI